jgi:MazG family protein
MKGIDRLLRIMRRLRDPEQGCPWDRAQTFTSIVPHTLEEAYEVAEAIENGNLARLLDELGDLLFQVVFYAQLAAEAGQFDFEQVAQALCDKLERRHPHVFANAQVPPEDLPSLWDRLKRDERALRAEDNGEGAGALDGVSITLPALTRARKLQQRAARVGFDWPLADQVIAKIEEELGELRTELRAEDRPAAHARCAEEIGDLLFACVNLARHARIDPETALRAANRKFERRFAYIESALAARGLRPEEVSLEEMDRLWDEAKAEEDNG